jgi:hypothetical protein
MQTDIQRQVLSERTYVRRTGSLGILELDLDFQFHMKTIQNLLEAKLKLLLPYFSNLLSA